MILEQRFKKYLEDEFHSIKPTKEAMEYREEVYSTLLDHARNFRNNGENNEDIIYDKCIDTLGDFDATLKMFEQDRLNLKKAALKTAQVLLIAISAFFIITVAYLAISFVTKAWSKTWLIEVCGAFLVTIGILCANIPTMVKKKRYFVLRFEASIIITLLFVALYLAFVVLIPQYNSKSWMIFLAMVLILLFADCALAYSFGQRKSAFIDLLFLIMALTTFLYICLALLGFISWGIFWILPVAGAAIDVLLVVIVFCLWSKKKKEELDEKYYTTWKE